MFICSENNCDYTFYSSRQKLDKHFAIRTCNLNQTCGKDNLLSSGNLRADGTCMANLVQDKLKG